MMILRQAFVLVNLLFDILAWNGRVAEHTNTLLARLIGVQVSKKDCIDVASRDRVQNDGVLNAHDCRDARVTIDGERLHQGLIELGSDYVV